MSGATFVFGNNAVGTGILNFPVADGQSASRFYLSTQEDVDALVAYHAVRVDNARLKAVIWADNAGEPGSLVAASRTYTTVTGACWAIYRLGSTVTLSAGWYWLGLTADTLLRTSATSAGTNRFNSPTGGFDAAPTDPFGAASSSSWLRTIYAVKLDDQTGTGTAGTYTEDFSSYTVGSDPTGWTKRWNTAYTLSVVADANSVGGKYLQHATTTALRQHSSWDLIPSCSDVDIIVDFEITDATSWPLFIDVRSGGAAGSEYAYGFAVSGSSNISLRKYTDGASATLVESAAISLYTESIYRVRVQAIGNIFRAKLWFATRLEPNDWLFEIVDQNPHDSGLVGIGGLRAGNRVHQIKLSHGTDVSSNVKVYDDVTGISPFVPMPVTLSTAVNFARAMGGRVPVNAKYELTGARIYVKTATDAKVRVAVYTGGSEADGMAGATLLADLGENDTGFSANSNKNYPCATPVKIPAGEMIWVVVKGDSTNADVVYVENLTMTGSFQPGYGQVDITAEVGKDSSVPFPSSISGGLVRSSSQAIYLITIGIQDDSGLLLSYDLSWGVATEIEQNAAWNLLDKVEQQSAWGVLNTTHNSTSWDLLNQKDLTTAWHIAMRVLSGEIAWDLLTEVEQEGAWSIFHGVGVETSWYVLYRQLEDVAWRVLAEDQKEVSWRSTVKGVVDAAWGILRGQLSETAWGVRTEQAFDSAWRISDRLAQVMAWDILGVKYHKDLAWKILDLGIASTDWKILEEKASFLTWRVLTEEEKDLLWRVCVESGVNTSWPVLNTKDRQTAWDILTAENAEVAWRVLAEGDGGLVWKIINTASRDLTWAILQERVYQTLAWWVQNTGFRNIAWKVLLDTGLREVHLLVSKMDFKVMRSSRLSGQVWLEGGLSVEKEMHSHLPLSVEVSSGLTRKVAFQSRLKFTLR